MTVQPWHGEEVTFEVDGQPVTAHYNPAERTMMRVAHERGCSRHELEVVHLLKAELDATIVDAEDRRG